MSYKRYQQALMSILAVLLIAGLLSATSGCGAYFNTFFNARKAFNKAEKGRQNSPTGRGGQADYSRAIEKAIRVIENHPNSKYFDDALYVLGVSYYHTGQYAKAQRRFQELLTDYENSGFGRESHLYLAKSALQLGDIDEAMELFEQIFQGEYDRRFKGEAAIALGTYHYEQRNIDESHQFLQAVRDSLGSDDQQRRAQTLIADGFFESFRFAEALGAFLQLHGMSPDKDQEYHALFSAAECAYRLERLDDGYDYLDRLVQNERYFDSLSVLKLKMAEGYELGNELDVAELIYDEVATGSKNKKHQAEAYYRLGLIHQFDYDQLVEAKSYYDKAVEASRGASISKDAIQRSSDIGKLATFARTVLDTTVSQDVIDEAAYTQYLLAELYWFQLNKPDTAIIELQYLIDFFPTAYIVPKAMVALSQMYREHSGDEKTADSLLYRVVSLHGQSDYVVEALDILGLRGTAADTGYAESYIRRAEKLLFDGGLVDSAQANYAVVVDRFRESKYYLQARFNLIWITEMYHNPGDSSVIFAYQSFVDSFPGTEEATAAQRILSRARQPAGRVFADVEPDVDTIIDELPQAAQAEPSDTADTATTYADPTISLYRGPEGKTLTKITANPIQIERPFEFPVEAMHIRDERFSVFFQILLDFSGKVVDYILKIPYGQEEIDSRASETVASMTFDPLEMSKLITLYDLRRESKGRGHWFVYQYKVEKPEHLR